MFDRLRPAVCRVNTPLDAKQQHVKLDILLTHLLWEVYA